MNPVVLLTGVGPAHPVDVGIEGATGLGLGIQGQGRLVVPLEAPGEALVELPDVQQIAVLPVPLGGPHGVELEAVLGVELVGARKVVGPGVGPVALAPVQPLVDPLTGLSHHRAGEPELVGDLAGADDEGLFEETPRSELLFPGKTRGRGGGIGDDVERSPDGGGGQVHGGQPPLELDAGGGVSHPVPVGPVDPAVLHVVHRHAVDHDGGVPLVEAPDVDAGVPGPATTLGGVHAGGDVQHHGEVPGAQLVLDLDLGHVGVGHGGLPLDGSGGKDLEGVHGNGFGAQGEVGLVGTPGLQDDIVNRHGTVADHVGLDPVRSSGPKPHDQEASVGLREASALETVLLVDDDNLHPRQGSAAFVDNLAGDTGGGGGLSGQIGR
jgi:hypothetical protein